MEMKTLCENCQLLKKSKSFLGKKKFVCGATGKEIIPESIECCAMRQLTSLAMAEHLAKAGIRMAEETKDAISVAIKSDDAEIMARVNIESDRNMEIINFYSAETKKYIEKAIN